MRDLTLAGLGLAPSSVLLLRFVDDALNRAFTAFPSSHESSVWTDGRAGSDVPAPLASAVLERAVELPAPPSFDGDRKKDVPSSVATSSKGKGKSSSGEAKVPKWFKLGPSAFRSIVPFYPVFVTFYCREINFNTRMVPLCSTQLTREKLSCSCTCCMYTSDTRHIVDQCLLPKYTCSLPPDETAINRRESEGQHCGPMREVRQPDP